MADSMASSTIPPPLSIGSGLNFPGFLGLGANGLGNMFGLSGGLPGSSYIPVTPLGALSGLKGDLLVPMVAVGVAVFLLVVIVLAVKAALTWKLDMVKKLAAPANPLDNLLNPGGNKLLRSIDPSAAQQDRVNELAAIVMQALDSERCLDKIICSIGSYGQGSGWASYFSMIEQLVAEDYRPKLSVMKSCAEGTTKVEDFQCGATPAGVQQPKAAPEAAQAQQQGARPQVLSTLGKNASRQPANATAAPAESTNAI